MTDLLAPLTTSPRVLIEAALKPIAGTRIQPTGFPDLGPAVYDAPADGDGTVPTLLVESAQSMANRLEAVCWDEGADEIVPELQGLPYVSVNLVGLPGEGNKTSSLQEFHRLNSPYIMNGVNGEGKTFADVLKPELGMATVAGVKKTGGRTKPKDDATKPDEAGGEKEPDDVAGVVNLRKLAKVCFKYDPNSLVHGVFLEKIAGRLRHPRALSSFIEATGVGRADSGGVKFDRALPKPKVAGVDAKGGYGNVPFHRTEYTARAITAYFMLDLAQIRGYGLPEAARDLLIALSLWKVRKFLDSNMRLRTACELEIDDAAGGVKVKRPAKGFELPPEPKLTEIVRKLIGVCATGKLFAEPAVTVLTWNNPKG
jgi:CRISPR-associated protein Csb1